MSSDKNLQEVMNMLYEKTGSYLLTDELILYLITPVSILGFIFNLISLIILLDPEFKGRVYKYLRFYCANSILIELISSFFVTNARRFSSISNSYYSVVYICYIFINGVDTGYFISAIAQCFIIYDRISIYLPKLKIKINSYFICLLITIFCIVLNVPFFFIFKPYDLEYELNNQTIIKLYYYDVSPFSRTPLGNILTLITISIRDIGTLIVEIFLNIVSVYLLIRYQNRKKSIAAIASSNKINNADIKLSNTRFKLTIMVIMMSVISIIEHSVLILAIIGQFYSSSLTYRLYALFGVFAVVLKHGSNFLFFIGFNKKFRKIIFLKIIKIKRMVVTILEFSKR